MKKLLLSFSMLGMLLPLVGQAQQKVHDTFGLESKYIVRNLDSLLNLWYVKNTEAMHRRQQVNLYGFTEDEVPVYPDSVYQERIDHIVSPLPYVYNPKVKPFIDLYAMRKREQVEKMLGLSNFYFPIFEEVLAKNNMPIELKYLSVVESALNPKAVSRVGATGLWQFMYTTGKLYQLNVTSYVDDRRDPYKSTEAAARYLKDLHNIFGDWFLAMAAYNCGPGNVNKAIRRSGGKRTFWEIYPYLPQETRGYVPAFIAASYVFMYHKEHNLFPQKPGLPTYLDTVYVHEELSLDAVAQFTDLPVEMVRDLNPHFHKDIVPETSKPYVLRLPANKATYFCTIRDSVYVCYKASKGNVASAREEEVTPTPVKTASTASTSSSSGMSAVYYTVRSGDVLSVIADWYDVSIYSIKQWNGMKSYTIYPGQKLKIMVPQQKLAHYQKVNTMSTADRSKTATTGSNTAAAKTTTPKYYTIQPGDTLWDISKRTGVTVQQLQKLNNITDTRSIKPGQKIIIGQS